MTTQKELRTKLIQFSNEKERNIPIPKPNSPFLRPEKHRNKQTPRNEYRGFAQLGQKKWNKAETQKG